MAKRFKLRFSLPSFQFCRSKQSSSFPKIPSPATKTYVLSPVNPKAFEIAYPNFPDPPPSTPNHPKFKHHGTSKITPISSRSSTHKINMYNSSISYDSDDYSWPITPPKSDKKTKREKTGRKMSKARVSSVDSGWFSSEGDDCSEETESLISSFDSSYDFGYPLETISESPVNGGGRKKKKTNLKLRRLKRYVSNSWKGGEKTNAPPECVSPAVCRGLTPCAAEGKVNESFAVVKSSVDPYEDFKGSMLEMILEKEIFEAKDLEQLLQCFLSLNFRHHHAVIVQAFSEIWEDLFL